MTKLKQAAAAIVVLAAGFGGGAVLTGPCALAKHAQTCADCQVVQHSNVVGVDQARRKAAQQQRSSVARVSS